MLIQSIPVISAMNLRKEPGRYLDRVDLRDEKFIIERAGKPKAVLVPMLAFKQMERLQAEARAEVLAMNKRSQKHFAESGMTEDELDTLIEKAIEKVRTSSTGN